MRVRTPGDIAAFVPLAMGFVPQRSVVVVSVGALGGGMHARVDLPHDPDDVDDVVEALLRPARRNGVRDVVVVVYDDETTVADEAAWSVHEEFTAAGIGVARCCASTTTTGTPCCRGRPWPPTAASRSPAPTTRSPRRPSSREGHPRQPGGVAGDRRAGRRGGRPQPAPPRGRDAAPTRRPHALVRRHVRAGTTFTASELASVVASVRTGAARRGMGVARAGDDARQAVELWPTRCAAFRPPTWPVRPPCWPAAWLAGDGALSWCAVDRCREVEPATRWRASSRSCSVGDPAGHVGHAAARGRAASGDPARDQPVDGSGRGARD